MTDPKPSFPDRVDAFAKRLMGYKPRKDPRKEEQPLYATFQDRAIASVIDVGLIFVLLQRLFRYITAQVFSFANEQRLRAAVENPPPDATPTEMLRFYIEAGFEAGFFDLWLINSFIQSLIIGVILVLVWREFHTTPGKYIIGLEFANKDGEGEPSLRQYIRRYLGFYLSMPLFMIGFIALAFDKKKRAWHDHIGGTTVIYAKRGSIFRQAWDWVKKKVKK